MSEQLTAPFSQAIINRPNILLTYPAYECSCYAQELSEMLIRKEINVYTEPDGADVLCLPCPTGSWHMAVVADKGLTSHSFKLIEKIRSVSDIPILTVSTEPSEIYTIMALSKGADICMGSGAEHEFMARMIALLRRQPLYESYLMSAEITDTITNGAITLDRRRRVIYSNDTLIPMTAIEYGIMEYLMENCGYVCTIDDIYRRAWHENPFSVKRTVVEHIRKIRSKIEPDPKNPSYIKAVVGIGYKMVRAS